MRSQAIKIKKDTVNYDAVINRFRVSSSEKDKFESECGDAGITTTQAFRGFMRAVNNGAFTITPVSIKKERF